MCNFLFQCSEQPCHPGGHASMIPRVAGLESKPRKAPASRVYAAEAATTATTPSSADQPVSPQPDPGPSTHQVTKEHGYCLSSPRKMKRKIDALAGYAESYKKKIKNVQQQSKRLAIKKSG
ncbi:hypothetical protein PoB_002647400 [Plakobranchus ocellatus]|uniref:Uncharacterized protein n=1 Tax=Plakobranchus ocellatus TaxID=259542 RepID=A0AAV4A195_9GAST|nr:hypothetical protein PoB_002647400 [Plakobranchus ocellatus]